LCAGHRIALLAPSWSGPIFGNINGINLISLPSNGLHGFRAVILQTKLLRKYKIETGILLTPSFSSALSFFLAGVGHRYGYPGDGRKMLLNYPFKSSITTPIHRSQKFRLLLEHITGSTFNEFNPSIFFEDAEREEISGLLVTNGLDKNSNYLVMAPQAVAQSRRWGTSNYRKAAVKLSDYYAMKIILLGTAAEFPAGEEITGSSRMIINLCGKTDIAQAAAILSGSRLFIGNDSGLAHLAAAVNIPLIVLSGADNPLETSPLSNKKTIIIKNYLPCISCVRNRCPKKGNDYMKCMNDITIDEVFEAASKWLL